MKQYYETEETARVAAQYDREFQTKQLIDKIPFLAFKPSWVVKIIPPFGGASVRFLVAHKDRPKKDISVYLDYFNQLGCMSDPYWELYPNHKGNISRFYLDDTESLMKAISVAVNARKKER